MVFIGPQLFVCVDRHHCFKSGDIPKNVGGQIHLSSVTVS